MINNLKNLPNDTEIHLLKYDFFVSSFYWIELIMKKSYKFFEYKKWYVLTLLEFGKNNF